MQKKKGEGNQEWLLGDAARLDYLQNAFFSSCLIYLSQIGNFICLYLQNVFVSKYICLTLQNVFDKGEAANG